MGDETVGLNDVDRDIIGALTELRDDLRNGVLKADSIWMNGLRYVRSEKYEAAKADRDKLLAAGIEMRRVALEVMGFRSYSKVEQTAIDGLLDAIRAVEGSDHN